MRLGEVLAVAEGELLTPEVDPSVEAECLVCADLMSEVLAYARPGALLVTGVVNPQVVRTADVASVVAILFTDGRKPEAQTVVLARQLQIPLMVTAATTFEVSKRLVEAGLVSCDVGR